MKIIRTVLGDIPASEIGKTDSHDPLIRSGGPEVVRNPMFLMDDTAAAKREFGAFLASGGKTMVCMDPIGCGRNVGKMAEIAEAYRGQGNLVMVTGFHKAENYDPRVSFLATVDEKKIAALMCLEITDGMDLHSYNGPVVERTAYKAGLIKAGTSYRLITHLEQKALRIAAMTQRETGCAISIHTENGTMGPQILDILAAAGADLEKTVLCHVQRDPNLVYYKKLLDRGAVLCIEEANKPHLRSDQALAEILKQLVDAGYEQQLLLGMDGGRQEALAAYMAPEGIANGLSYLFADFAPMLLQQGISASALEMMLVHNPARVFSMEVS